MANIFITSDTHFGHVGVTQFMSKTGEGKLRPWDNVSDMDEALVANWNSVVKPGDRVYHLGDVVINRKALWILSRLNGKKVLVKGNHDIFRLEDYTPYFEDIRAYKVLSNMIMSHIPLHPSSFSRFGVNVHGHTHDRNVLFDDGTVDGRYFCACVEQTNFTPISLEDVKLAVAKRSKK